MSDCNGLNQDWLEKELARQFTPADAPGSLWGRIEAARRVQQAGPQANWILWPAVVLMMLFASGDLVWEIGKARAFTPPLTEQDIAAIADGSACDFKSGDPAQIERWVKARTNMDVNLSCGRSGDAHPLGARLIRRHGTVIAAIAYQVGNSAATLLISETHSLFRWNRDYAIASSGSGNNPGACNQCHVDARSQL